MDFIATGGPAKLGVFCSLSLSAIADLMRLGTANQDDHGDTQQSPNAWTGELLGGMRLIGVRSWWVWPLAVDPFWLRVPRTKPQS